jgi:DNA-binding transcriptional ArsR family regulator
MGLNPTLWRTCRVLAGPTRLKLLSQILQIPDQGVTRLAEQVQISESRASQELRRLQSRGLVQAVRCGRWVRYRPVPDPQVASAKPLLMAMKTVLTSSSEEAELETIQIARAFSHSSRLHLLQLLLSGPCSVGALQKSVGASWRATCRHLAILEEGAVVCQERKMWEMAPNPHPLVMCMIGLVESKMKGARSPGD